MESLASEDAGETEPISTQSLYATLGLSPEDVDALAKIPESEISVETLPYLIMELKGKRANKTAATTDTEHRHKPRTSQEKQDTPEKRKSPLSSSSRRPGSHDHEHHGKEEGHRSTGGRRDSRHRSSREKQSGDDVAVETEVGDPTVFPHECSQCKCVLNSIKTWKEHLLGYRHKSRDSKSSWRSSRSSLPHKRPYISNPIPGDTSMSTTIDHPYPPKPSTKVVVAKFHMGAVSLEELLELSKPFGTVVKHLVFPAKGFLEFASQKEAQNMVRHYQMKPAFVKENRVTLYLSPTVDGIHSPPWFEEPSQKRAKHSTVPSVVCFSRLPSGDVEAEVLKLADMFGEVRQSKFTDCKALIEMVNWRDADIMVKYYHSNPLRIQGRTVKVYMAHVTSLREDSPEHPSRKGDTSSKPRDESSINKEKTNSSNQDNMDPPEKHEEEDEEGIQMEDEPGLLDDATDDIMTQAEEEETKMGEEEPAAAQEDREDYRERALDDHPDDRQDDWQEDAEFPENIEDFVTLDELDSTTGETALDKFHPQEGKVVVVWPVRKKHNLLKDLSSLCAPFGTIVKHTVSVYRQEAVIELETDEKAQEMVQFYRKRKAKLCGRPVSVYMSFTMKTIESPSGRSVFISFLPTKRETRLRYTHKFLFKLAEPFGKLTGFFLNKKLGTSYLQFEMAEAAEKMVAHYACRPCRFLGSVLKISMCRKGDSLIRWRQRDPEYEKKEFKTDSKEPEQSTDKTEKDQNDHSSVPDCEGVCGDPVCEDKGSEDTDQQDKTPLGPYQPDHCVGVNYVIPVAGFFCKLCNVFYSDENKAKFEHCKTLEHYNNLKVKCGEVVEQTDGPQED